MRKRTIALAASLGLILTGFLPAAAEEPPALPTRKQVERALANLRLPTGSVNGNWDADTRRAVCAWREHTGRTPSRLLPSVAERAEIINTLRLPSPSPFVVGLHVNVTCQTLSWIIRNPDSGQRRVHWVFPVSTGMPGYDSPQGRWSINREIDGWHESTLYEDAMMYRPKYFAPNVALHGSATDALVHSYPASHGCVRMLHADIDRLWTRGVSVGTRVWLYGEWDPEIG